MNNEKINTLVCIVGEAGTGKDTIARLLARMAGWNIICSYTTRPMREGEQEGVEHHFVSEYDVPIQDVMAYTRYGDYEYWTTYEQIQSGTTNIYVIDDVGLIELRKRIGEKVRIIAVRVTASEEIRLMRGVTKERMERDKTRLMLPYTSFQHEIHNDGSMSALIEQLAWLIRFVE